MKTFEIEIDGAKRTARLPFFALRFALLAAYQEQVLRMADGPDGKPVAKTPDRAAQMTIEAAALGACCPDLVPELEPAGTWSDILEYGEAVLTRAAQRHTIAAWRPAAQAAIEAVFASLPTQKEVDRAAAPFSHPPSTDDSSLGAPPSEILSEGTA